MKRWLEDRINGDEPVGVSELVLSGMLRIITNRRAFVEPATPEQGLRFCRAIRDAPSTIALRPGPRHWEIFTEMVSTHRLRGNQVPDVYHAALALEHDAAFATLDRGFARFEGLRLVDPLAA